jgi:hypothetical protein
MAGEPSKTSAKAAKEAPAKRLAAQPTLLAGGNPQIAKADGDVPVQAYIAAMPGWKQGVGRRLDALIVRTLPDVRKAVRWNSPFYGIAGQGWFLGFHCFTRYVKVTFNRGTSLRPVPPGASRHEEVRYLDIRENDELDEAQMATWIRQATALPGWVTGERQRPPRKRQSGVKEEGEDSPSRLIDARIEALNDWRGATLARVRTLIKQADPEVVEEWKWRGVPVWSHAGIICTGETYKKVVKMTFAKAPRWRTLQASSTPAWKVTSGVRSIFMKATRSMKRR